MAELRHEEIEELRRKALDYLVSAYGGAEEGRKFQVYALGAIAREIRASSLALEDSLNRLTDAVDKIADILHCRLKD